MTPILHDVRFAVRSLSRSPGLVFAVVLSLALGIGANATIFSLVNAIVLRPMPGEHPSELVSVFQSESDGDKWGAWSVPAYRDLRDRSRSVQDLAGYSIVPVSLSNESGEATRVFGAIASGNYFRTLGVGAALGRTLGPEDDQAGAPAVAMMSHGLWKRRFGADPRVLGTTITLNAQPVTVVGVTGDDFRGATLGLTPDLWLPLARARLANPGSDILDHRGNRSLMVLGRMAPGNDVAAVEAEMNVLLRQMGAENVQDSGRVATALAERDARIFPAVRGPVLGFLALLVIVTALVLLVACTNVAGLMLARATARRREMGIRLALGAGRGRLIVQLLTESVALALLGGAAGLLLAMWGTDLLLAFKPPLPVEVTLDLRPDGRVVLFTFLASVLTGIVFGLAPALESARRDVLPALRDEAGGPRRSRLRSALVVTQIALSALLLAGGGLFLRGLWHAAALDPGFRPDGVITATLDLDIAGYDEPRGRAAFDAIARRVAEVPGMESVALIETTPLGFGWQNSQIAVEGHPLGDRTEIDNDVVTPGALGVLGIPLVRGRDFTAADRDGAPPVAIVNQEFARRYWPGQDPLGKRINLDANGVEPWIEVVGVARDIKYHTLNESPRPFFYLPHAQRWGDEMALIARTSGPLRFQAARLRDAIRSVDPQLPVFEVRPMTEAIAVSLVPARLTSVMLGAFGALALLLAVVGLYGVVAVSTAQRTREIGIRVALGALPRDVLNLILGQGMRLAIAGVGAGLAVALAVTHLVRGLLFGVSPADPITFATIAALLAAVTLFATWLPARRAARIDPALALRHDA